MKTTKRTTKRTTPAAKNKLTKSGLADALGISRQALNVHLKAPDAPPIDDIAAWQVLLAERGRIGSAPAELRAAIAAERLKILQETSARLARENQIANRELMPVADAIRHATTAGSYFFESLERLCRELPPCLAGCSAPDCAARLEAAIESVRRELKAKMASIGE